MNLLIDYETYGQTAQMTHVFFQKYAEIYKCEIRAKNTYSICKQDIHWADIVLAIRPMNPISNWIADECRRCLKVHISMYDDNLLNHLRDDPYMRIRKRCMEEIIKKTQILLTTNPLLSEYLRELNPNVRTARIDTVVEKNELKPLPDIIHGENELKLVYYSNDGTTKYFQAFMPEVIRKLSEYLSGIKIKIDLIGVQSVDSDLGECEISFVPHMGYTDFKSFLRNGQYVAGISPIVTNDNFSKYKYFNKFIEYTSAGIVGIYTNAEPYTFEVVNGQNGFLCDSSSEKWVECIVNLFKSPELRLNVLREAYKTIEDKHSFSKVTEKIVYDIPELRDYESPEIPIKGMFKIKMQYRVFWIKEKVNATLRYLKTGGVEGFINRTHKYLSTMSQISKERNKED